MAVFKEGIEETDEVEIGTETTDSPTLGTIYDNLKNHMVCYFDVLGFKQNLEDWGQRELFSSMVYYHKLTGILNHLPEQLDIKSQMITDNVIVFFECDGSELDVVKLSSCLGAIGYLQLEVMKKCGFTLRGGASIGKFYHDGFLFGQAYLDAYTMESRYAIYARILVDERMVECVPKQVKDLLFYRCEDGRYMINYLDLAIRFEINENPGVLPEDLICEHERLIEQLGTEALKPMIDEIENKIKNGEGIQVKAFQDMAHMAKKYNSLLKYHLSICSKYKFVSNAKVAQDNMIEENVRKVIDSL